MKSYYDIVVIGSGPGGQEAAITASKLGKQVAIIERERSVGGACVHQGTIPNKTLREAAITFNQLERSSHVFDFNLRNDLEVSSMIERMNAVVEDHTNTIQDNLKKHHIDLIKGRGRIGDSQTVVVQAVDGRIEHISTQSIIIATGSKPQPTDEIQVDHEHILDSDSILSMLYLPKSLTVIGAGIVGAEYASVFSLLGVEVTLIGNETLPLPFLDEDLSNEFLEHFLAHGGKFIGDQNTPEVKWDGVDSVETTLSSGRVIKSEKLLFTSGRIANISNLGLEALGIMVNDAGNIEVDESYETNIPGIYAIGDVIGHPALVTTSMEQGRRAARNCVGVKQITNFNEVPVGIYAVPEIASVGIDEKTAANQEGIDNVVIGKAEFKQTTKGQIMKLDRGFLKLVGSKKDDKLLGVQIIGDNAAELIHLGELAIKQKASVQVFLDSIINFPTLSEVYQLAARAYFENKSAG